MDVARLMTRNFIQKQKEIGFIQDRNEKFLIDVFQNFIYTNCSSNIIPENYCHYFKPLLKHGKNYMRKYFKNYKLIEKASSNQNTLILTQNEELIAKFRNKTKMLHDDFLHEAFIGMIGINSLYSNHFVKILGLFQGCNFSNEHICEEQSSGESYILMENIKNSILYSKFCQEIDLKSFFLSILQVLSIIRDAQEKIGFVHYDLHTSNILVQDKVNVFNYNFIINDLRYSDFTIKIIDFGLSRIEIADKIFYSIRNEPKYDYSSFEPLMDVYRFLMGIYRFVQNDRDKIFILQVFLSPFLILSGNENFEVIKNKSKFNLLYEVFPELIGKGYDMVTYINHIDFQKFDALLNLFNIN